MRNTKIKTSGLNLILKSLGYHTNVVVNHIPHGYKTILVAMKDDAVVEMHLTLKEYLFREDSKVLVRFYNMKKDHQSIFEKVIDTTDRKSVAKSIAKTFEAANRETGLFIETVLKMIYLSLVNTKSIKEYYSAQKQIGKVYDLVDTVNW